MVFNIFKSKKIAPNTNNLILEIVEEYNKELYKSKVLKETKKIKTKKLNYSF
tara:strand:- start:11 stop:166 length:156 start_codon:yes stop_codon:yes gene_type:complete